MIIKNYKELERVVEKLRKNGKKIVTCNGSFDLMHAGHLKFLKEAKEQGDVLIIGLNTDKSIKKYKSKDRPIIDEKNRIAMMDAIRYVDYVVLFDEVEPRKLLSIIKPDVHVNGEEYGKDCIEAPVVRKYGGKIHIVKKAKGLSTSNIIKKIKSLL